MLTKATWEALPDGTRAQILDTLTNNEVSSDIELVQFWIEECDIEEAIARAAITYRARFLTDPSFDELAMF